MLPLVLFRGSYVRARASGRLDLAITASTVTVKAARVIASGYTSQENDAARR
jgi:hypothetical protein